MLLNTALARLYATIGWCEFLYPAATRTAVLEARALATSVGTTGLQGVDPEGAAASIEAACERLSEALKQAALEAAGAKTVEDLLADWERDVVVLEPESEEEHPPAPERLEA
jgi:hypothetical protein